MNHRPLVMALLVWVVTLTACSQAPEETMANVQPVAIEKADECHLCGMLISEFDGPKGELFEKDHNTAKKFCSTRDMFSYYLQPENQRMATHLFVHDMSRVSWDKPDDKRFIDAKSAWYVKGSSQTGAMGPTLASFDDRLEAEAFAALYGGEVIRFEQISLATLQE